MPVMNRGVPVMPSDMSAPNGAAGEPSMWNGPSTVAGVAPGEKRLFSWTTSVLRPSTSEARMNSWRLSSLSWPAAVSHSMAAVHSLLGELDLAGERVEVPHQRRHQLREPWRVGRRPPLNREAGDVVLGHEGHRNLLDSFGLDRCTDKSPYSGQTGAWLTRKSSPWVDASEPGRGRDDRTAVRTREIRGQSPTGDGPRRREAPRGSRGSGESEHRVVVGGGGRDVLYGVPVLDDLDSPFFCFATRKMSTTD